jgi:hypothetical protein
MDDLEGLCWYGMPQAKIGNDFRQEEQLKWLSHEGITRIPG